MTAFYDAASAIRSRMQANWSATPIVWENTPSEPTPGTAFVFLEILNADAFQASIGAPTSRLYRHTGVIQAHVFTPVNKGTKDALQHADAIAAIFRGQTFSGVLCFAPRIGGGELADDDGNWWRVTVSIPFQFDKTF